MYHPRLLACALLAAAVFLEGVVSTPCPEPCGGCFKNDPKDPALAHYVGEVVNPAACLISCAVENYPYSGVEGGKHCYCGTDYDKYGESSDCDMKCPSDHTCGGENSITVWASGGKKHDSKGKRGWREDLEKGAKFGLKFAGKVALQMLSNYFGSD